jgi:predicted Zn-dependent protease
VVLATRTGEDSLFADEALLDAAIHEVGHAMGMPHSTDSADVMFPTTRTGVLTERDLATARLLYSLPPGSLKGPPQ